MSEAATAAEATDLVQASAELGRDIQRMQAEIEHGVRLAGLRNDPTLPLVKALSSALDLQWRLHDQAVNAQRDATGKLDQQLEKTLIGGSQALEERRSAIVQALAPELATLVARSVRTWNRHITMKTGLAFVGLAFALAVGTGGAGYTLGWQSGRGEALLTNSAVAGAIAQAGPGAEEALAAMVHANNLEQAWANCQRSAVPDKEGRRVCSMLMWADPERQPNS